ncbi:MAG: LPS-assembly protein LptD, partial [Vicinamibacterales bacterium]
MVHLTRNRIAALVAAVLWACPSAAMAQISLSGYNISAYSQEKIGEKHWLLSGSVELERNDTRIYADSIEYFEDEERAIATGNVVVTQGENRIAADRADFNTRTQLGTFYHASGIARVRQPQRRPAPGAIAPPPQLTQSQENDVFYFGETVEKLGAKKYRISNGGFSTCVQPTPRWDLTAGTIILNIDHYTLLRQMLLNVKGVPMLYLPFFYYPTKEEERATGFLIPTYGVSTLRGQTIHNAFFWAINRSQDATFLHDWFSKTGTGTGAEYRYNQGGGSDGQMSGYVLDQRQAEYVQTDGSVNTQESDRSFMLNGLANQTLPGQFRARGRVAYFSSLKANQTFNTNVASAARNQRSYAANVVGVFKGFSLNGTFERTEWFNTTTSSAVVGSSPRILLSKSERPLFRGSPVYFGLTGEYAKLDRQTLSDSTIVDDRSLGRMDFNPQIRYPFKRWTFFTVNTTLNWRNTYYTRSLDPTLGVVDSAVNRQYVTMTAQALGPSFVKVWDTPNSGYAERFKHTIEPYFNIQRTSSIDAFDRIIKIDGIDNVVGNTTSISYGLQNRIYAKRRFGRISRAQEILAVEISQTYYTDARQSQLDARYATNTGTVTQSANKFSPIAIVVRATPGATVNGNVRAEIDSRYHALRTVSATGTMNWRQQVQNTITWSRRFLIPELPPFDNPA